VNGFKTFRTPDLDFRETSDKGEFDDLADSKIYPFGGLTPQEQTLPEVEDLIGETSTFDENIRRSPNSPGQFPWMHSARRLPERRRAFHREISSHLAIPVSANENATDEPILDENCTETSIENRLNQDRLRQYQEKYSRKFLDLLGECEFEFGFDTIADDFIRERLAENASVTKEWINSLFLENWPNTRVVAGILRTIAHLEYHEITPEGPTMAFAANSHPSLEVRECGIRAFENWGTRECLGYITKMRCTEGWMQEYLKRVIDDLEESFSHVPACKED